MHLSDIQSLLGPSSSVHVVWDEECFPSLTLKKVRPSGTGVLNKETTRELYRMLESDKVRVKFHRWPKCGYVAIEKNGSDFSVKFVGFMTIVVPQTLVDHVFNTGETKSFDDRGYTFKIYREESRHGAKWVKTEVCKCAPGLSPNDGVRYKIQLIGQGKTLSEAFQNAVSSAAEEVTLPRNAWYS